MHTLENLTACNNAMFGESVTYSKIFVDSKSLIDLFMAPKMNHHTNSEVAHQIFHLMLNSNALVRFYTAFSQILHNLRDLGQCWHAAGWHQSEG